MSRLYIQTYNTLQSKSARRNFVLMLDFDAKWEVQHAGAMAAWINK